MDLFEWDNNEYLQDADLDYTSESSFYPPFPSLQIGEDASLSSFLVPQLEPENYWYSSGTSIKQEYQSYQGLQFSGSKKRSIMDRDTSSSMRLNI